MIRKQRHKPIKLLKTEALLRRTPDLHPRRHEIELDYQRLSAGYKGEQSLDYHLSFLPREPFLILHDLRLDDKTHHFQIDTLILHPSFFLIIEVKNFTGTLYFDPLFDQMIRTKNGEEEAFPDPIRQVKRQADQLLVWLNQHKCDGVPIESVVVIANSQALLKTSPGHQTCLEKVIRDTRLVETIKSLAARHRKEFLSMTELRRLASGLIRNDTPLDPDVLAHYGVAPAEIVTGVRCPECGKFAMERAWGKWRCPACDCESKDAHRAALRDYGLFFGPTISNREARDFLRLSSSSIVHDLLLSLGGHHNGANKGRAYDLSKILI